MYLQRHVRIRKQSYYVSVEAFRGVSGSRPLGLAGRQPSDISLSTCAESATCTHDALLSNPDPFSAGVYIEVAHY